MSSIAQASAFHKVCHQLSFSVLEEIYPRHVIQDVLRQNQKRTRRERKLNHLVLIYLLIAWSVMAHRSLREVCDRLLRALRLTGEEVGDATPTSAAYRYRRRQIGVRVLCQIFHRLCRPCASTLMPGSFAFGLRLMGLDGTKLAVADTPENRRCFRPAHPSPSALETTSPFPHLQAVLLVELGTHAIVDAIPGRGAAGEIRLAKGLLRSIEPDMLVLMDRGFFSAAMLRDIRARQAHVLGRLASNRVLAAGQSLADGSTLVTLRPSQSPDLTQPLTVRVISYRLHPQACEQLKQVTPSRSQHGSGTTNPALEKVHRLVTTLLDPEAAPALELCLLYHERWEVELVIDEIKEHQRVAQRPLVSKSLVGVLQEFYALLLAHYALRLLMAQAAARIGCDPDRLSFTHTIEVVSDALFLAPVLSGCQRDQLTSRLLRQLGCPDWAVPPRRLRFNSRVLKRSRNRFQIKRSDHVFLSAKDLALLPDPSHASFRELLLI